jgi:osmotically-inducible protein OsmY
MDDLSIKREVETELEYEPSVNAAGIGVAVKDGIVTLFGQLSSLAEKESAGRAAARVAGVKAVVGSAHRRGDRPRRRRSARFERLRPAWPG